MLGFSASQLGLACLYVDPSDSPPAAQAGRVVTASFDDPLALQTLAIECDVITYEFENVPVDAVRKIENQCTVYPPTNALETAQDRLAEKQLFEALDIPLPGYRAVDSAQDLQQAASELGLPLVVKTRRFGYDGKGQVVLRSTADIENVVSVLGGTHLIAEQFVDFDYEVSAIGVRNANGDLKTYPLSQNEHHDGILRVSRAPATGNDLAPIANDYLERMLNHFDYVGVLALELFVIGTALMANEFAPRVHNSGHWTIEGAITSQFENHMRAISGMPLGNTGIAGYPGMFNIIGEMPQDTDTVENLGFVLHNYGKSPRPGRKLGHATIVAETATERDRQLNRLGDTLSI